MASRGDDFYKQAEKEITKWFGKDWDEGSDLFSKAGASYKVEREFEKAGDAYMRAGDCCMKAKDQMGACSAYTESAKALQKVNINKAKAALQIAIQMNIDNNRLSNAAKLEKEFGEALDEDGQPAEAIPHFEKAYNYYYAEDQHTSALNCKIAIAKLHGEADRFQDCIPIYEEIGEKYATGPLKYQAKEYFLRATICRCALVTEENRMEKAAEAQEAFENYLTMDPQMKHSREQQFCEMLLASVENSDLEEFDEAVSFLNELKLLDDWKTHVLFEMKKNFEDAK